ncbi:MAG: PDZ domain-containing protein [Gammaproteobacteria bacterium]|nr:PDZ domain-containing protein [Gammaproteobacteria bacterium]
MNKTVFAVVALLAPLALAAPAVAHDRDRNSVDVEVDGLGDLGHLMRRFEDLGMDWHARKAHIGIAFEVDEQDGKEAGVIVKAVTPDGPAEKAGLKAGDVLLVVRGENLEGVKHPGQRMLGALESLEPGEELEVAYRRDGKTHKTSLVAAQGGPGGQAFSYRFDGMPHHKEVIIREQSGFERGAWGEVELVSLNPDLGAYFGAKDGVLVVAVPQGSDLKLRGGDVIESIAGRTPKGPSQTFRILNSYDKGESIEIRVRRKGKSQTLAVAAP